jgi:hypothetical protein
MPKWLDTIVGGWQLNWMIRLQEGMPYALSPNAIPISGVDPNAVPGGQRLDQWINPAAFALRTDPFALQEWSTISGRIRLPPINNFEFGTTKTIHITERWTFEFLTNWVNAFNTPQWFSASCRRAPIHPTSMTRPAGAETLSRRPRRHASRRDDRWVPQADWQFSKTIVCWGRGLLPRKLSSEL